MVEIHKKNLIVHHLSSQLCLKTPETDTNSSDQTKHDFGLLQSSSDESEASINNLKLPTKRSHSSHCKKPRVPFIGKTEMDVNTMYKSLIKSFIFSKFRYPDLVELIYSMTLVRFKAGSAMAHNEIETSDLFVVKSGKIKIEIGNTIWEEIGPGGLIGEISLLHDAPHIIESVTLEDSECWVLHNSVFDLVNRKNRLLKVKLFDLLSVVFGNVKSEKIGKLLRVAKYEVFCPGQIISSWKGSLGSLIVVYDGVAIFDDGRKAKVCWEGEQNQDYLADSLVKCLSLSIEAITGVLGSDFKKALLKNEFSYDV